MVTNGVRAERLVDYIGEYFGHLDSILCLVRRDEVDSMSNTVLAGESLAGQFPMDFWRLEHFLE